LYDLKHYTEGPFATFTINDSDSATTSEWSSIKFSNDGKLLLVSTLGEQIMVLDSFDGKVTQVLNGRVNNAQLDLEASFTPDAKYVMSGSQDGAVHFWDVVTGRQVVRLEGHREPSKVAQFNPRFMMMATADSNLVSYQESFYKCLVSFLALFKTIHVPHGASVIRTTVVFM
jgi:COMPASS component SWD2